MIRFLSIIVFFFCQISIDSQEEIVKLFIQPKGVIFSDSVYVEIKGSGEIYYTLDGKVPSRTSKKYNRGFYFNKLIKKYLNGKKINI